MTLDEATRLLKATQLMLLGKDNQPISDLYYALQISVDSIEELKARQKMSEVQKYKQAKAVINDIPNYMEYQPTKEQNEAFDVVLELLNKAIEKATVPCFKCRHYKETDAEWRSGRCLRFNCQTFAEETCDYGENEKENDNEQ